MTHTKLNMRARRRQRRNLGVLGLVLTLGAPATMAEPLAGEGLNRGTFGPFVRSLNTTAYGYSLSKDSTGKAPATLVERFEVRAGDCAGNKEGNDCERDRERSELSEKGGRNPRGSSAWYGWDFYLGPEWPEVWPTKTVIGQFHQDHAHPVWMFLLQQGRLVLDDHSSGHSSRMIELIGADELKGRWHRIEVQAKWETDASGVLRVWVDGVQKVDHSGPTMSAGLVYFKYGVYRAFVSRYKLASGQAGVPTQVALYANVRRATSREGLR